MGVHHHKINAKTDNCTVLYDFGNSISLTTLPPNQISGLLIHLDASDLSTINTGSPVNNDPIDVIKDKSGNGNDFIQTGTKRPLWKSSGMGVNDLPTMLFDGINNNLKNALLSSSVTVISLFFVYRINNSAPNGLIIHSTDGAGAGKRIFTFGGSFESNLVVRDGGTTSTSISVNSPSDTILCVRFNGATTTRNKFGNSISEEDWTDGSISALSTNTGFVLGSLNTEASDFFIGEISELLMYDRELTDAEGDNVLNFLKVKYDIPIGAADSFVNIKNVANLAEGKNGASVTNGAFNFDGIDDFLDISGIITEVESDTIGSVEAWVRTDILSSTQYFFSVSHNLNASTEFYVTFGIDSTGKPLVVSNTDDGAVDMKIISDVALPNTTDFHHIVITQDGTIAKCKIYLNGGEVTTTNPDAIDNAAWFNSLSTDANLAVMSGLLIGGGALPAALWDGEIRYLKYYNSVLTATEIKRNFLSQKHR